MSNTAVPATGYNRGALFWICVLALFTAAAAIPARATGSGVVVDHTAGCCAAGAGPLACAP